MNASPPLTAEEVAEWRALPDGSLTREEVNRILDATRAEASGEGLRAAAQAVLELWFGDGINDIDKDGIDGAMDALEVALAATPVAEGLTQRPHNHAVDGHHWQDCPGCDDIKASGEGLRVIEVEGAEGVVHRVWDPASGEAALADPAPAGLRCDYDCPVCRKGDVTATPAPAGHAKASGEGLREAVAALSRAYHVRHSPNDGECEHGFSDPLDDCPNSSCDERDLQAAFVRLTALSLATPAPAGLDVERLISALNRLYLRSDKKWDAEPVRVFAEAIAAEYARLQPAPRTGEDKP